MSKSYLNTAFIALLFTWCGLVLGLAFIETPLKFMAPGITLQLGLGIGQLVFAVLNRIEIGLSVICVLLLIGLRVRPRIWIGLAVAVGIVAVQALFLLPVLDQRVEVILAGGLPPPSRLHIVYIAAELTKLAALTITGVLFTHATLISQAGGTVPRRS